MPTRILIIEDEKDHAFLTKTILQQASKDYQPEYETDAIKGLRRAIEEKPDIILCDYRLPDLTGLDILRELRKKGIDVPFIVVTASGNERIAVDFMKEGAYDYVLKDVAYVETLNLVIRKALERYKSIKEKQRLEQEIRDAYVKLKETRDELIQSEKMAALGAFSSGVAHEVKNPLGVILGGTEFLEMKLSNIDDDTKTALEKIKEATLRADSIIQGLLKFAKPSEKKMEKIEPEDLINITLSLVKYRCPLQNIEIKTGFEKGLKIEVDKNQIQQVVFNILMNAIEALPNGGIIEIKTKKTILPEYSAKEPACLIEIIDTGDGMSQEHLSKLFVPFFTTKREGKGTGLGMSIAKTIVDNHKGKLLVDSQLNKGTDVKIILPLAEEVKE